MIAAQALPDAHEMLDTRTNEWLVRLQANGPKLVSLVIAALILLQLVQIGYSLLAKPLKSPQAVPAAPALRPPRPGFDLQTVTSAHLFGLAEAPTQDPATAPQSSANLILAGTIATQDPKRGVAIIAERGGPSKVYAVGERVGGASLHSVYLDRVILDRAGALETLQLPRQILASNGAAPLPQRQAADPGTAQAVENIRRMVQQDPGILDQVMRTVPSYDNAAGKLRGFRAYPGRNRQIFNKLGLKAGDLVTAINGTSLDDPQHSQEVFNTIQTSDHVTVTVERGGQKQDITLNIAQVAAQATHELESDASGAAPPGTGAPPPPVPPEAAPPATPPTVSPNNSNEN
ncbi:MAG TPA: type II secretion system protein GspC [Steroidobacteraceae bacterium]|jgi:general secretion pathway protein C